MTDTATAPAPGFFDTFMLNSRAACERAMRWGGIAGAVNAALAVFFALREMYTRGFGAGIVQQLVGAAMVAALAFFVFRRSRVAAALLLGWYLFTKAVIWYQLGAPKGIALAVVFILFYATALRAALIWRARYAAPAAAD